MAIFTISGDTAAEIGGNPTDDRYVIDAFNLAPGQQLLISDTLGANTLHLTGGLAITASAVTADALLLTLSNGAQITLLGADAFDFQTGGNGVNGIGGQVSSFATFVTDDLGLTAVPTGSTAVSGGAVTVDETGGTTPDDSVPMPTYSLTADAASVDEGEVATFSLATTNVDAGTAVDYTITGVDAGDISGGLTGSVTIGTDGTADIAVQVLADQLTEGVETLTVSLDNGAATASTQVQDTSVTDAGSYISGQGGNGVVSDFNIQVVFESEFSVDQRAAFELAADYLSHIIVGDLPAFMGYDDISIIAVIEPMDGLGNVLASARPEGFRDTLDPPLPFAGLVVLDIADIPELESAGTLADLALHEMMHVLGFGSLWESFGLIEGTTDLRFTGDNAIAAYNAEFPDIAGSDANSATGVPVETDGGEGTAGGHWDEDIFTNELMTGIGMAGTDDYTSGMTVAALEDMGYDTVFDVGLPGATMPQLDDFVMA